MRFLGVQGKAQRRGMRPRRAEQYLPEEDATPKWDAGALTYDEARSGVPAARSPLPSGNALGHHSISRSCNAVMRRKKRTIRPVANSP